MMENGSPNKNSSTNDDLVELYLLQKKLSEDQDALKELTQQLAEKKTPATVVFFDLVGSTSYRRIHGAEKGLEKSHRHNFITSQSILDHDGQIVKWLGDGVCALFQGRDNQTMKDHPIRALDSAIDAIMKFQKYNESYKTPNNERYWEEIHTRIGLSSGWVHLLKVERFQRKSDDSSSETPPSEIYDPIGSCADLAQRLQSLAFMDVILIDCDTFWGLAESKGISPICLTAELQIKWCEIDHKNERTTVYRPEVAVFKRTTNGIEYLPDAIEVTPRAANEIKELVDQQGGRLNNVFVSGIIPCNIAGFKEQKNVIAVSLEPKETPVKEAVYDSPSSDQLKLILDKAERLHRQGNSEALKLYEKVLDPKAEENDPRDFCANFRLAQHFRENGDFESLKTARKHWNAAKLSNPFHPVIWALAGTTHFETFLQELSLYKNENYNENMPEIKKAINDFSRARNLAAKAFDTLHEQYCICLLTICYLILPLGNDGKNLAAGKKLFDETWQWPTIGPAINILKIIANVFYTIAASDSKRYTESEQKLNSIEQELINAKEIKNVIFLPLNKVNLLVRYAKFLLGGAMDQAGISLSNKQESKPFETKNNPGDN